MELFNIKKVKELTIKDSKNSLERKLMKIGEECGELNQAALAYVGASNASRGSTGFSDRELRLNLLEEACDVLNSTMNVIFNEKFTDAEIRNMFDRKLSKWESKL